MGGVQSRRGYVYLSLGQKYQTLVLTIRREFALQGFEPRFQDSKSCVLNQLDERAVDVLALLLPFSSLRLIPGGVEESTNSFPVQGSNPDLRGEGSASLNQLD